MLVIAQLFISFVGLLGALAPQFLNAYFRQVDDAAWIQKNGSLLIEETGQPVGDVPHEEMKRELRLGIEREQYRKFVLSRVKYPVFPAYFSAALSVIGMLSLVLFGIGGTSPKVLGVMLMVTGIATLVFTSYSVRNALLNIVMSASLKEQIAVGRVRYPVYKSKLRKKSLRVSQLRPRQLWRAASKTLI